MASRNTSRRLVGLLASLVAAPLMLAAQAPAAGATLRLSFADAVRVASSEAPAVALAGLRADEADARVGQVRAALLPSLSLGGSAIAGELGGRAGGGRAAGVSAVIDVTRARTQLVTAEGLLLVARNQLDRGRIDLTRTLGIDPATPLAFTDTLAATLGAADVPAARDSLVAAGLANRPDSRAELARAGAARQTGSAIRAERLPRLEVAADYGVNGRTVPGAISTRVVTLQLSVPTLD